MKWICFSILFYILTISAFSQFTGPFYDDTYSTLIETSNMKSWGPYNVHDPSLIKVGDWFYMFSTDAMVGYDKPARVGIQVRKSRDLVYWEFYGFAFDGIPSDALHHLKTNGKTATSIWAPCIFKHNDEFRLYYCVSAFGTKISYLGLATSTSPEGPWTQRGCVVKTDNTTSLNAIDPAVVEGKDGKQWLVYGSYFDGIYCLPLNEATGLAESENYKGTCIARRRPNAGVIEAPEIIYNANEKKYYLFLSYDNLLDKYNIRVGRSDNPEGPYYDVNNVDLSTSVDNYPMILHPYKFTGHTGWQGTGHCGIIYDSSGQFYLVHQGRPYADKFMMVMHVRRIEWVKGWPVLSPERFGGIPMVDAPESSNIPGKWEHMILAYKNSGFEMSSPLFTMQLDENGTINADPLNNWKYNENDGMLYLSWNNGQYNDTVKVWYEWDWENKRVCMVYSGFGHANKCIWGKSTHSGCITSIQKKTMRPQFKPIVCRRTADGYFLVNPEGSPSGETIVEIFTLSGKRVSRKHHIFNPGIFLVKIQSGKNVSYTNVGVIKMIIF